MQCSLLASDSVMHVLPWQVDSQKIDVSEADAKHVLWHVYMLKRSQYCNGMLVLTEHNAGAFTSSWAFGNSNCNPWYNVDAGGHELAENAWAYFMKSGSEHQLMRPVATSRVINWKPPRTKQVPGPPC